MNRKFFLTGAIFRHAGSCVLVLIASAMLAFAQADRATPLLSGTAGFVTSVDGGHAEVQPVFAPVLLVPIRQNWLIESRAEFEGDFERKDNGTFGGPVGSEVQYLQLDYIANKYVTISAGRFLTPFGIYNERLYPLFIRNFQQEPFTLGLVGESSDGAMLRGGISNRKRIQSDLCKLLLHP